jgi:hypothetical protein
MAKKETSAAITPFLSAIGNTEVAVERDGEVEVVTNYELLARQMWDWARGWTEQVPVIADGVIVKYKPVYHPPDKSIAKEIYARMEGRPTATADVPDEFKAKPVPLVARLDEQIVRRLNKGFAEVEHEGTGRGTGAATQTSDDTPCTEDTVSGPPSILAMQKDRIGGPERGRGKPTIPKGLTGSSR